MAAKPLLTAGLVLTLGVVELAMSLTRDETSPNVDAPEAVDCDAVLGREDSPRKHIERIYGNDGGEDVAHCLPHFERLPYSKRLAAAFAADDARADANDYPIGRLDFDYVVNGQDFLITNVQVTQQPIYGVGPDDPERVVITSRFDNFGSPQVLDYYWVKEDGRWGVDEVVARPTDGSRGWVLSLLLNYGFYTGDDVAKSKD